MDGLIFTLVLTPALSPGERGKLCRSFGTSIDCELYSAWEDSCDF